MINKLRSFFTGYRVSKAILNGLEVKTYYWGRKPSSDPLAILRDLKLKLHQIPPATELSIDFSKCWEEKMRSLDGLSPSFTATFQVADSTFSISRFVTKQDKSPVSQYTFSENETVFAFFSRVYDHGDFFKEIENDLLVKHKINSVGTVDNGYFITDRQYSVLFDVFGHSQSFFWNDQKALERSLAGIG